MISTSGITESAAIRLSTMFLFKIFLSKKKKTTRNSSYSKEKFQSVTLYIFSYIAKYTTFITRTQFLQPSDSAFLFIPGLLCHLDDACTSNPCHADAICDTSPINGSYTCSCASGYKGIDCSEDIDECKQGRLQIITCKYRVRVRLFHMAVRLEQTLLGNVKY